MKYLTLTVYLITTLYFISCTERKHKQFYSQSQNPVDTIIYKRKLPIYEVKPCLRNLLDDVAEANSEYYNLDKYFYSLSFRNVEGRKYLLIETTQYKKVDAVDYNGAVKVVKGVFLCRGGFAADSLFTITGEQEVEVSFTKRQGLDDVFIGREPSLRGLYQECNEDGISIEVYRSRITKL